MVIVCVDDHVRLLEVLKEALLKKIPNVEVVSFPNTYNAREYVDTHKVDLVLVDMRIGEDRKSGLEFANYLQKKNVRVVVVTSEVGIANRLYPKLHVLKKDNLWPFISTVAA